MVIDPVTGYVAGFAELLQPESPREKITSATAPSATTVDFMTRDIFHPEMPWK
jgi:hypothetical protein